MGHESLTIGEYLSAVASERVTPAGGTTAALVGAAGASLCEMVCIHTVGKEGYEDVAAEMTETGEDLAALRSRLLGLADADARAVDDLLDADAEDRRRALKRTIGVPLTVADACLQVLESAVVVTAEGSDPALADAGSGAMFASAALEASTFTVRTNLDHVDDAPFVEEIDRRTAGIEREGGDAFERVRSNLGVRE